MIVEYNLKDCEVTDVSIIGNIIRYETRKDNLTMNIDVINNDIYDICDIRLGDKVNIFVPKKQCIFLTA